MERTLTTMQCVLCDKLVTQVTLAVTPASFLMASQLAHAEAHGGKQMCFVEFIPVGSSITGGTHG